MVFGSAVNWAAPWPFYQVSDTQQWEATIVIEHSGLSLPVNEGVLSAQSRVVHDLFQALGEGLQSQEVVSCIEVGP